MITKSITKIDRISNRNLVPHESARVSAILQIGVKLKPMLFNALKGPYDSEIRLPSNFMQIMSIMKRHRVFCDALPIIRKHVLQKDVA